ncbi:MAG: alpha-glucuronidase [Prolixibacteraceae bacterium]|nr:alpha-glucuronidase [Prolixibacteraceae bacterium]MBN2650254.1 alpha-glucuronidase [Prolixibacteraceae bacterium]
MKRFKLLFLFVVIISALPVVAEDGYDLWLRYKPLEDVRTQRSLAKQFGTVAVTGQSETVNAIKQELQLALGEMLATDIIIDNIWNSQSLLIGTPASSTQIESLGLAEKLNNLAADGYIIQNVRIGRKDVLLIASNSDVGALYGTFHLLRLMQTNQELSDLDIVETPKHMQRILNHWDNLDRTVERGYAGFSIWDWHKLPRYIYPQYIDYARANASIGINGTVLTNVNANALVLTDEYIDKAAALADVFRPYGIKVYLTARFSAPIEIGGLETADPLNEEVKEFWKQIANNIYKKIPDFGGFLVKADSEGQPGPHNYKRTHAEGANTLAEALEPHGGIVMWRAFVYSHEVPVDRALQAYNEFVPLDGKFNDNVLIQVKNGPIDFQPREPYHPLFGAMPKTPLMMEFQITQEYLGHATHLTYLAPLYTENLNTDTHIQGEGSTVAKVLDGTLHNYPITAIAGVANIGTDRNWTGHLFGQSNWYAFGRLAWDNSLSAEEIAEEWIRMTLSNDKSVIEPVVEMMMESREIGVNYRTPIGLHHIMAESHHYGPGPWVTGRRPDWTSVYYHNASENGVGFDRTVNGSNAVSQYPEPLRSIYNSVDDCPEKFLLWFHHLPWDYEMKSGRTLWNEMVYKYYTGADSVTWMQEKWNSVEPFIDDQRFKHVKQLLEMQRQDAIWWRNSCVLYFQQFSKMPIPDGFEKPENNLEYYENKQLKFVPGI